MLASVPFARRGQCRYRAGTLTTLDRRLGLLLPTMLVCLGRGATGVFYLSPSLPSDDPSGAQTHLALFAESLNCRRLRVMRTNNGAGQQECIVAHIAERSR
jgi:hypothetical protein